MYHRIALILVVALALAIPATAQVTVPKTWTDPDTLTPADLNANFGALTTWGNLVDPDADGVVAGASSLSGSRLKWARDFLAGSTTCGISEAIASFPSSSQGGTVILPSNEECTSVTTTILLESRFGVRLVGHGMGQANTEMMGPGVVCDADSTNARPLTITGTRLNLKRDPNTGDPAVNYAALDCDQVGPVMLHGVTFESFESGVVADVNLYDTPTEAKSVSVIGVSGAPDESRVRWVSGDPRNEETCESIKPPGGILATDDIGALWRAPWRTTIASIWCRTDVGTVNANLQNDDGTPADIATADLVCDAAGVETSALASGEQVVARGNTIGLDIASVATSPTELTMCWRHRR